MGEAKRRGTYEQRKEMAIKKKELLKTEEPEYKLIKPLSKKVLPFYSMAINELTKEEL